MEENNKSLILVNNSLAKIEKQISIGEKILKSQIDHQFNEAFFLLNSKHMHTKHQNFYLELLKDENYILRSEFKYLAKTKRDYLRAIEIFDEIILRNQNSLLTYYFKGVALRKVYAIEESIIAFTKTIELDRNFKFGYYKRGKSFDDIFEYNLAIKDYTTAIELDTFNAQFYFCRGITFGSINDEQKEISDYNKCIELDSKHIDAYSSRAMHFKYKNRKNYEEDFKKVIAITNEKIKTDLNNEVLYYNRGWAKQQLDLFEDSLLDFDKALELNPDYSPANFGKSYTMGMINVSKNDSKSKK